MHDLIADMMKCVEVRAYYPALITAMIIPDICASIDTDGKTNDVKYKNWFDTYASKYFSYGLKGDFAYYMRCSIVHQGRLVHPKYSKKIKNIMFTAPSDGEGGLHNLSLEPIEGHRIACYDVRMYCEAIQDAVKDWLDKVENTENYKKNIKKYFAKRLSGEWLMPNIEVIASIE